MLFHAAGAEGSRPTFFEMAAADFLPASLKAAALYALGEELPRHHHGCCTCHERAAMSLNAHSLSSLVSDPHSPGVGTAPPVAALPARLDHSHELSAAALRCAAVQAVIRVQGVGTAPPLTAPPAGPQRRALCCCAAAARVALA
ncbi:unnamed protein product [Closterium sp. NIES-54]